MGLGEIILILAVALILFGPEDLPKIARVIGKLIYETRKLTHDFTKEFENFIETPEQKKSEKRSNNLTKADPPTTENSSSNSNFQPESGVMQPDSSSAQPENVDPLAELPKGMVIVEKKDSSI